jgi:hypothetical protein
MQGFRARFPLRLLCLYALSALVAAGELSPAVWLARALQACLSSTSTNTSPLAWSSNPRSAPYSRRSPSRKPHSASVVWRTFTLMSICLDYHTLSGDRRTCRMVVSLETITS